MVTTRRSAKAATQATPAPSNTLNAPPKRGRKKAVVDAAAAEPAPAKPTKTTAVKRKATAEPEAAELPAAKRTATTRATRVTKTTAVKRKATAEPELPAAKRTAATRATRVTKTTAVKRKATAEPEAAELPAAKRTATTKASRVTKATRATKTTRATKAETKAGSAPVAPKRATRSKKAVATAAIDEAPKAAPPRTRKAPAKKTAAAAPEEAPKTTSRARKVPVSRKAAKPAAAEAVKPTSRARSATAPKLPAPAPAVAGRPTRGRNVAAAPHESPLKAPARKPTKKATAIAPKAQPAAAEEPFADFPGYPSTPDHIVAPMTAREAMGELPHYPSTPAHIRAPISTQEAMAALPGYPDTPAHVAVSTPTTGGLHNLPPDCSATPVHVSSPDIAEGNAGPHTPTKIVWGVTEYPKTPERVVAQLSGYPATPSLALEAAIQEEITASVKRQTPSPLCSKFTEESSDSAESSEVADYDMMDIDTELAAADLTSAPTQQAASMPACEPASPKKSALRSPEKADAKTPKKAVTWDDGDDEEGEVLLYNRPLQGLTFLVDVVSGGMARDFIFTSLLQELGAKIVRQWATTGITHVLFKDGSMDTLEKVAASKGAVKCVSIGWVLDCDTNKKHMDEGPYLVDLPAAPPTPTAPVATPARTPSRFGMLPSSECKSIPTTPTSSEIDGSVTKGDKEKENTEEMGLFFQENLRHRIPWSSPSIPFE